MIIWASQRGQAGAAGAEAADEGAIAILKVDGTGSALK
jgi:hypothetical protein